MMLVGSNLIPSALSLSKGVSRDGQAGFDKLSPNGVYYG